MISIEIKNLSFINMAILAFYSSFKYHLFKFEIKRIDFFIKLFIRNFLTFMSHKKVIQNFRTSNKITCVYLYQISFQSKNIFCCYYSDCFNN